MVGGGLTDDNVVLEFYVQCVSGSYQVAGNFDVGFGWACVPAGVVVADHNTVGALCDGGSEDFSGVDFH